MNASLQVTLKSTLAMALMTLLLTVAAPATAELAQNHVALQEPAPAPTPTPDEDGDDDWGDIETDMCRLLGSCIDD